MLLVVELLMPFAVDGLLDMSHLPHSLMVLLAVET